MSGKFLEEVGFWEVIGKQDDVDKAHFPQAGVLGGHKVDGDWNHQMERKKTRKTKRVGEPDKDVGSSKIMCELHCFAWVA